MLKQAYIEETPLFPWHCLSLSIEWHKEEGGSEKNDKLWRGAGEGGGSKNSILRVTQFLNDSIPFQKVIKRWTYLEYKLPIFLSLGYFKSSFYILKSKLRRTNLKSQLPCLVRSWYLKQWQTLLNWDIRQFYLLVPVAGV